MRYREQINIILMRDNGPRHSCRMRLSHFAAMAIFFGCLPFVCAGLAYWSGNLWEMNKTLTERAERLETDARLAVEKAEKLQYLEELLDETSLPARDLVLRRLAGPARPMPPNNRETVPESMEEGPGHEEFAVVDTGAVKVDNVQIRLLGGNGLRIGLDLRNPESDKLLSGEVTATLVTADGEKIPLVFSPSGAETFKISRFKRATMISHPGQMINMADGQVVIEVKDSAGSLLYRNIYAVQS